MFIHNIDPVLFRLGTLEIRYYGLFYVAGFVIAYFLINYLAKQRHLNLTSDDVAEFLIYLIVGTVLGARVVYVAVYNPLYYLGNPLEILALWHGGLSFHGGFLGASIASLLFIKKQKHKGITFYKMADVTMFPLALGLMIGRIGNFMNGELYGRVTSLPWAVKFKDASGYRHPSQLYESAKNLFIFAVLWWLKDRKIRVGKKGDKNASVQYKKLPDGFLFYSFIILYAILRFLIEFVREPDSQLGFFFGWLTMGQILNILMLLVGSVMMWRLLKHDR
ncbi:TPA: prolipoprotein diacylglyceryl transferase [Candidatus Woesearchaeota archaeon]|nr:prolipoprotein diacylglyceryl transferase [Candidatus Woesearchaeota archaeon]